MTLAKFRHRYPQGSLVSELIEIDGGTYIVKALVQIDNVVLATALAGAATVEAAEDAAKERAIATLFLDHQPNIIAPVLPQFETRQEEVEVNSSTPESVNSKTISSISSRTSDGTGNHQIVNFSKTQGEQTSQRAKLTPEVIDPDLPEASDFSSQHSPDLFPAVSGDGLNSPIENNLFGDAFNAETAQAIPAFEEEDAPTPELVSSDLAVMDFNEIKQKTDIEIKRLSWTKEQGKEFLMSRYGKRSRLHLTDEQLLEFLRYLEKLPNPVK